MKIKQCFYSVPLLLASLCLSQHSLAEVLDISATRLTSIQQPINYEDASRTIGSINSLTQVTREAAVAYFFNGAVGNFDKFDVRANASDISSRRFTLSITLELHPGYTLPNGTTSLVRNFQIYVFNEGRCVTLDPISRYWTDAPDYRTSTTCRAANKPELGEYYVWQMQEQPNSSKGVCEQFSHEMVEWIAEPSIRLLTKNQCQNLNTIGKEADFRWMSYYPTLATGEEGTGKTIDIKANMPQIDPTMRGFMQSAMIPAGYQLRFYEQENYQGGFYTRDIRNRTVHANVLSNIKSMKVLQMPSDPEVLPPSVPDTILLRVRYRGAYDGVASVSYLAPDGLYYTDSSHVNTGGGYEVWVPYGSVDVRFSATSYTGIVWAPQKQIFEHRASPLISNYCTVVQGGSSTPFNLDEEC